MGAQHSPTKRTCVQQSGAANGRSKVSITVSKMLQRVTLQWSQSLVHSTAFRSAQHMAVSKKKATDVQSQ